MGDTSEGLKLKKMFAVAILFSTAFIPISVFYSEYRQYSEYAVFSWSP